MYREKQSISKCYSDCCYSETNQEKVKIEGINTYIYVCLMCGERCNIIKLNEINEESFK